MLPCRSCVSLVLVPATEAAAAAAAAPCIVVTVTVPGSIEANARNELGTGVINSVEKSSGGRKGVLADPDPDKDPDDPVQKALTADQRHRHG